MSNAHLRVSAIVLAARRLAESARRFQDVVQTEHFLLNLPQREQSPEPLCPAKPSGPAKHSNSGIQLSVSRKRPPMLRVSQDQSR